MVLSTVVMGGTNVGVPEAIICVGDGGAATSGVTVLSTATVVAVDWETVVGTGAGVPHAAEADRTAAPITGKIERARLWNRRALVGKALNAPLLREFS